MKIVIIGSGNVATLLSLAIQKTPYTIIQVYSRSEENARTLAYRLKTEWTIQIHEITSDADLYLFALTDSVLPEIFPQIPRNDGIWIHTAGSISMDIFKGYVERYGVLYPLQTLSKNREINLQTVPFFVEANSPDVEKWITEFAGNLSTNVHTLDSDKRRFLHLAAVFACNFTNHMYTLAYQILEEQNISQEALLPLIDETAAKIHSFLPVNAQTGPAVRNDSDVLSRHIELLSNREMKEIYQMISKNIYKGSDLFFKTKN